MSDNNINLKVNGRLFPSWVLLNFKRFRLPKELKIDDKSNKENPFQIRKYQEFVSYFLDFRSPFKDILLYHGLGSGKTRTALNVYNILYNYTPGWNIYIILKASLRGTWLDEIKKWLSKSEFKERSNNIKFINYDSPFADRTFLDEIKKSDSSKKNMYIIEEAHNFINNVYNNVTSKTGKRAFVIYDYILQEKRENNSTRVMLITGTPAINNPFELALIFNLLRPNIFPNSELKFRDSYTLGNKLDPNKKNMFQRRILGLVSYYSGASKELFAEKKFHRQNVIMDEYQQEVYEHFEYIENMLEKKNRQMKSKSGKISSTYRSFTRQSCNFTFPVMSGKLTGETRPRPSQFRLSKKIAQKIAEVRLEKNDQEDKKKNMIEYIEIMKLYVKEFDNFLNKKRDLDKKKNKSIMQDIDVFLQKYDGNFIKFNSGYKNKSELLKGMYACSCKMTAMCFNIFKSKGPVLLYSNYVRMEGLEILKVYLKYFTFHSYDSGKGKDNFRYVEYHGSIKRELREQNRKTFNDKKNVFGKLIKLILISPAGSEGISLMNVRQVHVLEPYWNEVRTEQLIGRAIRQKSHFDLAIEERYVDIFRYYATRKNQKKTADEDIQGLADKKYELIGSFLTTIKEAAVDCELFKEHNIKNKEYKCFKFNQDSLFDKQVGPAYKEDLYYDSRIDNGLNSINSVVKKIKVFEIKAIKRKDDGTFSSVKDYLFDNETGIVYNYDLEYAVGKVYFDEDGIPEMKDNNTFIISEMIPIPKLKFNQ